MAGFVTGQKYKVHNSYIWLNGLIGTLGAIAIIAINAIPEIAQQAYRMGSDKVVLGIGIAVLLAVVLAGLVFGLQLLGYKNLSYEFGEREFTLNSGIITKRHVHVPYEKVQSVNHHATLFQRIVGVCSVSIETAGGAANKAVRVPYVQNYAAEMIRSELFARKGQPAAAAAAAAVVQPTAGTPSASAVAGKNPESVSGEGNTLDSVAQGITDARGVFGGNRFVDSQVVSFEYGLSGKELFLATLTNSGLVGALVSLVVVLALEVACFMVAPGFMEDYSNPLGSSALSGVAVLVVLSTVGLFVAIYLITMLTLLLTYGGFKACRRGSRIEVEQGLIQRTFNGIDIDRVQSVIIKQTLIRRLMGYCEISLGRIDSGMEQADNGKQMKTLSRGMVVHPFVKEKDVETVLRNLIPEYDEAPREDSLTKLPKVATRRAVVRRCIWRGSDFWGMVVIAAVQVMLHVAAAPGMIGEGDADLLSIVEFYDTAALCLYVVLAVMVIIRACDAVLWAHSSGFAYNKRFMVVRNGGFGHETTWFPRLKIQYGYTRRNPFQAQAKVATINAVNASGVGGTAVRLWDVDEEDAGAWLDWVKPKGNMVE